MPKLYIPRTAEWLLDNVYINERGCWEWLLAREPRRYGFARLGKTQMGVHRLSWIIHNGPIPDGLHVCHKCDNPICCNPEHLFLGTALDNAKDRISKGRLGAIGKPGRDRLSKITYETAEEIRREYGSLKTEYSVLSAKYGLSKPQIGRIIKRQRWAKKEFTPLT